MKNFKYLGINLTDCARHIEERKNIIERKKNFFLIFRATHAAYGSSQARRCIGATATGLCHSHSNAGSKPRLRATPQLTAPPDP